MSRATSDEWNRYYDVARQRRHAGVADPIAVYRERKEAREKLLFVAASVLLLTVIVVFYSVLVR